MYWRKHVVAALVAGIGLTSCAPPPEAPRNPLRYTENAKRDYEIALDAYFDHDWETAVLLFAEVRRKYGYSRYARLAELRIADAAYRQDNLAEAIAGYKAFVHDHPNDPEVPYARYRISKGLFEESSENFILPPLEERDLASIQDARVTLVEFLDEYPGYKHAREMRYMLEVTTGVLARHELYVARFYLRKDNYQAAVARTRYALENYKSSGLEAEALVLLGETYMKMKKRKTAGKIFRRVLKKYPQSAFTLPAKNFLRQLATPTQL